MRYTDRHINRWIKLKSEAIEWTIGVKMEGMWENILRNHQNSLKSLFHRSKPSSPDAASAADDSANSSKPIPQLSPLANSVVSRCSKLFSSLFRSIFHFFFISFSFSFHYQWMRLVVCAGSLECPRRNCNTASIRNSLPAWKSFSPTLDTSWSSVPTKRFTNSVKAPIF